jgi:hypothetical protein
MVRTLTRRGCVRDRPVIGSSIVLRTLLVIALAVVAGSARAETPPGPEAVISARIAVWRFDALGIEPELVSRLETLFRMELDRLVKTPLPTRRDIDRAVSAQQRECTGEEKCLSAIGKKLGVDVMVTGTVGAMGDNYVLYIKAVDVANARQLQRITSDPLRGSPDELIESVRVAAYKLLAPDQVHGAIQVQGDLVGAEVQLGGRTLGKTPLPELGLIRRVPVGQHALRVSAPGYAPFEDTVDVHFQKVSQVVVRLIPSDIVIGTGKVERVERRPFYTRTWFLVGASVAAIAVGAYVGYSAGKVDCYDGKTGAPC